MFDQALGPCLTLCRGHYELLSDSKDAWKDEVVRLPMTRSNRVSEFVLISRFFFVHASLNYLIVLLIIYINRINKIPH